MPQIVSPKVVCASSELVGSNSSIDQVDRNFEGTCVQIGETFHNNSAFTALRPHHENNVSPVNKSSNSDEVTRDEQSTPSVLTRKEGQQWKRH